MNEVEKNYCIKIMNKMLIMHLFEPVVYEPSSNKASSESLSPHETIHLNIILNNLQNNQYSSANEWKKSIENLWLIPLKFNNPGTLNYLFAQEQKEWFERHFIKIPHNKFDDWYNKIKKTSKEIKNLLHTPPEEVVKPIFLQDNLEKK